MTTFFGGPFWVEQSPPSPCGTSMETQLFNGLGQGTGSRTARMAGLDAGGSLVLGFASPCPPNQPSLPHSLLLDPEPRRSRISKGSPPKPRTPGLPRPTHGGLCPRASRVFVVTVVLGGSASGRTCALDDQHGQCLEYPLPGLHEPASIFRG